MFEHLEPLEAEFDRLEADLPRIYATGDRRAARTAGRRAAELKAVVDAYREWKKVSEEVASARELLEGETDADDAGVRRRRARQPGTAPRGARSRDQGAAGAPRPERGSQRDRGDPGHGGGRGGEPLGGRPLSHVPALRRAPRPAYRGALEPAVRARRLSRRHVPRKGGRCMEPPQVRRGDRTGCSACR